MGSPNHPGTALQSPKTKVNIFLVQANGDTDGDRWPEEVGVEEKTEPSANLDPASSSNLAAGIIINNMMMMIIIIILIIMNIIIIIMKSLMEKGKGVFATTLRQSVGELALATQDDGLNAGQKQQHHLHHHLHHRHHHQCHHHCHQKEVG